MSKPKGLGSILDNPYFYKISQIMFAPGSHYVLKRKIKAILEDHPHQGKALDIGCGPRSWLWFTGVDPFGLDISFQYSEYFSKYGHTAVTGSSFNLPFSDNSFHSVWCIGVMHHLTDDQVTKTIDEMLRVKKAEGYLAILDALQPSNAILRPIAHMIRQYDRGRFIRNEVDFRTLLPFSHKWEIQRYTYTLTGLEMIQCIF